jgi:hypothetical protein
MSWASSYIAQLKNGQTVTFRPRGYSMEPRVKSGALCTVRPAGVADVEVDDVVLCRVAGGDYLHLVKAKSSDGKVLIGNNRGHVNGWSRNVYGVLVKTE